MTDEELKAIRERAEAAGEAPLYMMVPDRAEWNAMRADVSALLSDLDRSRTELAALRRGIAVVLDRAARGENVVAALAGLVR
jgi:monomeric isocitrate dehydrogenase